MTDIVLDHVTYHYGTLPAADDVSLRIEAGEFFALLGPSGSGKTTLLRLIAGFNMPESGRILIGGENVVNTPVYRRQIGFVFQNFALFPHMTVEENVAFGLESQHTPKDTIRTRVAAALALVQLGGLEKRRPAQLSGGQQQRVAFARAVVTEPRVLLLDEPLASLDRKLRTEMQVELRQLQRELNMTTIFVTHDQEEALTLADRIAVMQAGRIEQVGTPDAVYERPQTRFVAEFLGLSNIFTGEISRQDGKYAVVQTGSGLTLQAQPHDGFRVGDPVQVMVRPERMRLLTHSESAEGMNTTQATITHISYAGVSVTYYLTSEHHPALKVFEQGSTREDRPTLGSMVTVAWSPAHTFILNG